MELARPRELRSTSEVHPTSGYTEVEERLNSITHGLGLIWAIAALIICVLLASSNAEVGLIIGCAIYGATLVLLYGASCIYHSVRELKWKRTFLILDHACIYLLIAGTYTPFALGPLRGPLGWTVLGVTWALAVAGVVREVRARKRGGLVSSLIYLGMGWLCLAVIVPIYQQMSAQGFVLLVAGGVTYSIGVIFYLMRNLKYHHAIWHCFVLGGSACHWLSIMSLLRG